MREYGHDINIFMGTHDSQAKIDHITSFRATISTLIRLQFICEWQRPE